jgi:MoaA/NifB/PqqE/SkfB family radical SAM enzyme
VFRALVVLGFNPTFENYVPTMTVRISKQEDIIRFFALTNPSIQRKKNAIYGRGLRGNAEILKVEKAGMNVVYNIETETGNYVANGLVSKNCQGKILEQPLGRWEDKALTLLDKLQGKIPYYIYGGAYTEPLMNPYLMDFIRVTKYYGNNFGIHTNGSLMLKLEQELGFLSRLVFRAGNELDYISISLDAGTTDSHCKTKGLKRDWFSEIIEGIRELKRIKTMTASRFPIIRVCYLMNKFNSSPEEIAQIVSIMRDIGVDSLRFSVPYDLYGRSFEKVKQYRDNTEFPFGEHCKKVVEPFLSASADSIMPFIFWHPPSYQDVEKMCFRQCIYSYYQITYGADGYVYRCSSAASPTFAPARLGKITDDLEEFNRMVMANHDEHWDAHRCFRMGARCNRIALEINDAWNKRELK